MKRTNLLASLAFALLGAVATPAFAADTDSDGLEDSDETGIWNTDPNDDDTDGDGWIDGAEVITYGTSPTLADTDGDAMDDPADSAPLHASGSSYGGGANATFAGARTTLFQAPSGLSPYDGVGVLLVEGGLQYDFSVAKAKGVNALHFALGLHYDSRSLYDGLAGIGWTTAMDTYRTVAGNGNVTLFLGGMGGGRGGVERVWVKTGAGATDYDPPRGFEEWTLENASGTYTFTAPTGGSFVVSANGIESISDAWGNAVTYSWSAGQATSVSDSRGQSHTLEYYATGRFKKVTMADGAAWEFFYNSANQLWKVQGPVVTGFPSGITHEFRYSNGASSSALNSNLVGAADGKGQWWLCNRYDSSDRVVRQYVGGSNYYAFDYSSAGSQQVTVTDRAGNERVWTWDSSKLTKASLTERTNRGVRSGEGDYLTEWTTDSDGYLIEVESPRGSGVEYTLNAAKMPIEIRRKTDVDASNGGTDLVEEYAYDSSKNYGVTTYTDPEGHDTTYTLDANGRATDIAFPTLTAPSPDVTVTHEYTYNADGSVASFTDGEGKVTSYVYYTTGPRKGRLNTKTVDDGGLELTTTYDYEDWGDLKSVVDPNGNTTTYTVRRYGNVTKVESPSALGYVTTFIYDANLNVTSKSVKNIDWDGTWLSSPQFWVTSYDYTMMDQISNLSEPIASGVTRLTEFHYDANDNLNKVIRDGRETRMVHDERDLVYQRIREGGAAADLTERFDYDGNRNTTLHRNARSKDTTFEFDLFDRRTKTINALGHYEFLLYDDNGRVTEAKSYEEAGATDVLLAHRRMTYDEMGRAVKTEDALLTGGTTWYARDLTLDKRGLVTTMKDRRNEETDFAYDGAGRRISATDPLGNVTEWEYDANGNATAVEETEVVPGGGTEVYRTEFEFDALNRMKKQTVIDRTNSSNTKITEWKRSVLGVRKTIDPRANETVFTLDGLGRTTQTSQDMGSSAAVVTQWTFDEHDQVTRLRDDNGNDTDYTYDVFGRLVTKTYESTKTVSYDHDANGNVASIEDQNGTIIAQGFDDLDRLIGRDITLGSGVGGDDTEDFAYDALNRLTEAKDDDSIVQFTYDSLSRVLTEVQGSNPLGSTGKTVTYTWDAESNRTKIDYPSGFDANETRDALGRVSAITDGSSASVAAFDLYGPGLRRKKTTFGNTTKTEIAYDGFRRPTAIDHKTSGGTEFAGFDYGWDKDDNPLYEERSHQSGKGDVYSYDKANRLTKVVRDVDDPSNEVANPGAEAYVTKLEYDMDDVFNLTAYKTTPYGGSTTSTSYTTNAMNEYTAVGAQSLAYTDAGSLEDDGTHLFKYDAHEHLIEVRLKSNNALVAEYTYDALGLGRRTTKVVSSVTTRYVYAGQQSVEEYDGTGSGANLLRLFVFGEQIDQIVAMEAPDVADVDSDSNTSEVLRFNYHTQLIGSVTQVTGPSQSVVESYQYDPYGKITIKDAGGSTISASAIGNAYTYTGRQLDEETGLYYYRARMYSAELRRFVQRDPKEYIDGPNALAYCRARPTLGRDPSGEGWIDDAIDAVASAAAAVNNAANAVADALNFDVKAGWLPGGGAATIPVGPITITIYNDVTPWQSCGSVTYREHERGHIRQGWILGPLYWSYIAIPSVMTATVDHIFGTDIHDSNPTESTATFLGKDR